MPISPRALCSNTLKVLVSLLIFIAAVWGGLALYYQLPLAMPWLGLAVLFWAAVSISSLRSLWRSGIVRGGLFYLALHAVLLLWWSNLTPSNQHQWQDDVAQMTSGTVEGNAITLFNVRNFTWHSETDYSPRWETRHYDLNKLQSVDMLTSHWGMDAIAHVLV